MKLTLIGMSGSGKSYWSKKLEAKGFKRFCCDDLIEERLGKELISLGYSGIQDVAKWMGQPFDAQYKKNSNRYLTVEHEVMQEISNYLEKVQDSENIVIDATGSIIYLKENMLHELAARSKMIYLHTPSLIQEQMYEEYIKNPKPVIWGNIFSKQKGESDKEALQRCYPKLLAYRVKKYKQISEIIFDYYQMRHALFNLSLFSDILKKYD